MYEHSTLIAMHSILLHNIIRTFISDRNRGKKMNKTTERDTVREIEICVNFMVSNEITLILTFICEFHIN